ncbi:MAG: toll/interleukin-1 receptor domain-containing protein [Nannocystaceae bacterium]
MSEAPRLYLIHRSGDKAAAEALATALRKQYGLQVWFDLWEIVPGHDVVAKMEDGIDAAHGALVLVSERDMRGSWSYEEYTSFVHAVVEEDKFIVPVLLGEHPKLPRFLKKRMPVAHDDPEGIARAVQRLLDPDATDAPPVAPRWTPPPMRQVELWLHREGDDVVLRANELRGRLRLPVDQAQALRAELRSSGATRDARTHAASRALADIGRTLGAAFE